MRRWQWFNSGELRALFFSFLEKSDLSQHWQIDVAVQEYGIES
jgi:hypothetical protein